MAKAEGEKNVEEWTEYHQTKGEDCNPKPLQTLRYRTKITDHLIKSNFLIETKRGTDPLFFYLKTLKKVFFTILFYTYFL